MSVAVPWEVTRLALGPAGHLLYVAASTNVDLGSLTELNPVTGAVRLVLPHASDFSVNWLTPTWNGVWMSTATGNFGHATLFLWNNLRASSHSVELGQSIVASVAAARLWVTPGNLPENKLWCADPGTGRTVGSISFPGRIAHGGPYGNVVVVGGGAYMAVGVGLMRVDPSFCRP